MEITFRELVKKIHPDLNPDVENAGGKMAEATKWKTNPSKLLDLAIRWGLIEGKTYNRKTNTYTYTIGNVVVYSRKGYRAVIIDVVDGKGKRKGYDKVLVVDISKRKVLYFFIPKNTENSYTDIRVIGSAGAKDYAKAQTIYDRYIDSLLEYKERKRKVKEKAEEQVKETLGKNRDYRYENIWIKARTKTLLVKVIKTTNKRVYYWDDYQEKERFVNMSSVTGVYKR